MDIAVCTQLKTALLTYPKSGSCSLKASVNADKGRKQTPIEHQWDWHVLHEGEQRFVQKFTDIVPYDYEIYAFCREPVDRWVSTFVFLSQTKYNLFYSDISNVGSNIAEADNAFYLKFFNTLIHINNYHSTLNDMHTVRTLFPLLVLNTMYPAMHMVDLSEMNSVLCKVNNIDYDFPKENTASAGYSVGFENTANQEHIPIIRTRFHQLLTPELSKNWRYEAAHEVTATNAVRAFLHLEKYVYQKMVVEKSQDAAHELNEILRGQELYFRKALKNDYHTSNLDSYSNIIVEYFDKGFYNNKVHDLLASNIWRFRLD